LGAENHLQGIATWTDNAARAKGSERWLVDQGIVDYFKAQAGRTGVHEFKIPVTTQSSQPTAPARAALASGTARDRFSRRLRGSLRAAGVATLNFGIAKLKRK
jgi:hypothetical protein